MRRRNPFNQPKPAEWESMSKSSRKAWNRKHWRPHQYMVEVPLKRYATRKANQRDRGMRGGGFDDLARKIQKARAAEEQTNPPSYRKARHKAHRAERKRIRRDQRRIEREETYGNPRRSRNPGRRRRNPSIETELVYAIGDWLAAEQEQGQKRFYEQLESKPRNRLLVKTVWTLAHKLGITTRPQLDLFKAKHHRALMALV
jgi:hypothetical protein